MVSVVENPFTAINDIKIDKKHLEEIETWFCSDSSVTSEERVLYIELYCKWEWQEIFMGKKRSKKEGTFFSSKRYFVPYFTISTFLIKWIHIIWISSVSIQSIVKGKEKISPQYCLSFFKKMYINLLIRKWNYHWGKIYKRAAS